MFWWFTFWLMTPIKRSKKLRGTTEFLFGDSLCYFTLQIKEEKQIQVSQQCQKYLESLCIRSSSNLYHAVEGVCILSQMKFWMALFIFGFRIFRQVYNLRPMSMLSKHSFKYQNATSIWINNRPLLRYHGYHVR